MLWTVPETGFIDTLSARPAVSTPWRDILRNCCANAADSRTGYVCDIDMAYGKPRIRQGSTQPMPILGSLRVPDVGQQAGRGAAFPFLRAGPSSREAAVGNNYVTAIIGLRFCSQNVLKFVGEVFSEVRRAALSTPSSLARYMSTYPCANDLLAPRSRNCCLN